MRVLLLISLLSALLASPAAAQVSAASSADSAVMRRSLFRELFAGIALTAEQSREANRIIAQAIGKQFAFIPMRSCRDHESLVAIEDARDSALRALIPSEGDREKFDQRAAAMRPGPCILH